MFGCGENWPPIISAVTFLVICFYNVNAFVEKNAIVPSVTDRATDLVIVRVLLLCFFFFLPFLLEESNKGNDVIGQSRLVFFCVRLDLMGNETNRSNLAIVLRFLFWSWLGIVLLCVCGSYEGKGSRREWRPCRNWFPTPTRYSTYLTIIITEIFDLGY